MVQRGSIIHQGTAVYVFEFIYRSIPVWDGASTQERSRLVENVEEFDRNTFRIIFDNIFNFYIYGASESPDTISYGVHLWSSRTGFIATFLQNEWKASGMKNSECRIDDYYHRSAEGFIITFMNWREDVPPKLSTSRLVDSEKSNAVISLTLHRHILNLYLVSSLHCLLLTFSWISIRFRCGYDDGKKLKRFRGYSVS